MHIASGPWGREAQARAGKTNGDTHEVDPPRSDSSACAGRTDPPQPRPGHTNYIRKRGASAFLAPSDVVSVNPRPASLGGFSPLPRERTSGPKPPQPH